MTSFECILCRKSFRTPDGWKQHMDDVHDDNMYEYRHSLNTPFPWGVVEVKCPVCLTDIYSEEEWTHHQCPQPPQPPPWQCMCRVPECGQRFTSIAERTRHEHFVHNNCFYTCNMCPASFQEFHELTNHMKVFHRNMSDGADSHKSQLIQSEFHHGPTFDPDPDIHPPSKKRRLSCNWCGRCVELVNGKPYCERCNQSGRECTSCHRPMPEKYFTNDIDMCNSCTKKKSNQYGGQASALNGDVVVNNVPITNEDRYDIVALFANNKDNIAEIIETQTKQKGGIKFQCRMDIRLVKINIEAEEVKSDVRIQSLPHAITHNSQISDAIDETAKDLTLRLEQFNREGSGWTLDEILLFEVRVVKYDPLYGSSYIELPKYIKVKKAVLNIENSDNKCFLWSILAHLHHVDHKRHPGRVSNYLPFINELKTDGFNFPMTISQIPSFEKLNEISINIFGLEDKTVFPLHITKRKFETHVNLLLWSKGEKQHFALINSMSRLLNDRTKHNGKAFVCNYCLHSFSDEGVFKEHEQLCSNFGAQKTKFPTEDTKWLQFTNTQNQLYAPYTIYADIESYTKKLDCSDNDSSTQRYEEHVPSGYAYLVVCANGEKRDIVCYNGPNVIDHLITNLFKEQKIIEEKLDNPVPLRMAPDDELNFMKATDCYLCNKPLHGDRVRDHDHISMDPISNYRGAAHTSCNLKLQYKKDKNNNKFFIPVIFHGLKNYDSHLLLQSVGKHAKDGKITCIPNNREKYISMQIGMLRFIDSFQFLVTSLENLVNNLAKEGHNKFENMNRHFKDRSDMLIRKGVYPYSYVSDKSIMDETSLPPREAFYNDMTKEHITENDYTHAQSVWKSFKIKTMREYHDLYLSTDVLLLSDIFEHFRKVSMNYYQLDPVYYYTAPGLSWDSMLKMTGVRLELFTDPGMHLFVENGKRGGVSSIFTKKATANNPLVENYDPSKPNSYIFTGDVNSLYGHVMTFPLPISSFKWLTDEEIKHIEIEQHPDDHDTGYILEVDLSYPEHLHCQHNLYPLAPENIDITEDMLSPYTKKLSAHLGIKHTTSKKLTPNLRDKTKYVLHYVNLKEYMRLGLKLTKVHRVLSFKQAAWLKPYIEFNIQKRKEAKTDFEKDYFKLMINSVYGKTTENPRKRVDVKLITDQKKLKKWTAKPSFKSFNIITEDLVAIHLTKRTLTFNKPSYAGFCILDLSKVVMYRFHYDFMMEKYGKNATLLFTDTDSLTYIITTEDLYASLKDDLDRFDTSNYDTNHPLYSTTNKRVLGKMKDEAAGRVVQEFVGLRAKMYSMMICGEQKNTAKGIKKCVVKKELKHHMYKDCLENSKSLTNNMNMIRSYNHQVFSISVTKVGLSPYDDKRFVLEDGINTLAYGHYQTLHRDEVKSTDAGRVSMNGSDYVLL